jgi:hypothetical protein
MVRQDIDRTGILALAEQLVEAWVRKIFRDIGQPRREMFVQPEL